MTTVRIGAGRLELDGHADYGTGCDIVCAACSVLAFAAAEYALNTPGGAVEYSSGHMDVYAPNAPEAIAVAETGFRMLAEKYPGNVVLTTFE